ncbi:MAG TPA: cytidylate kinase-like family protein [Phycisphaerae bacterium]|nr:cytidylate kinase-like family protein [Phycisphaerae bacterium]
MAVKHLVDKAELHRLVEAQMRNWELLARAQRATGEEGPPPDTSKEVQEFVSISRAVGAGGYQLASLLGERLGWPVFDKQILQAMAGDDQVRARLYETMDERDEGWLESIMRWLIQGEFRREDYFRRLSETVLALARQSHVVFLGRGTGLILPQECGLRIRIIAPDEHRLKTFAERRQMDRKAAAHEMQRVGRERAEFIRRYFGRDTDDLLRFDLILNSGRIPLPAAVDLIIYVLRQRGVIE